jgi:two-component system sensor histidine kinase AgrC
MLGNLTLFFAFIVNFISFVLLGLLFQQITKYKLSLKEWIFFLFEVEVLLPIVNGIFLSTLNLNPYLVKEVTIYLVVLYLIIISYKHDSKIEFRYHFFYGLYPIAFYIVLHNSFFIICQSIFSIKINLTNPSLVVVLSGAEPFIVYYLVSRWLNIDISNVSQSLKKHIEPKIFNIINILMVSYFLFMDAIAIVKPFHNADNDAIRGIVAFIYLILLFVFLFYLNFRHGQEQKEELLRNQEMELAALENYSKHVESLYQEVRSFRHDYANVLMTLKMGIDQGNLDDIKKIYEEITADSTKLVKNNKFDLLTSQTAASKVSCQPNSCKLKIKVSRLVWKLLKKWKLQRFH